MVRPTILILGDISTCSPACQRARTWAGSCRHGLAHFVAGQAGAHGPQEEFVIVERVHAITGERIARWALGVEN
jgi:hypothetical protein